MKITHNKIGQNLNLKDTNKSEAAAQALSNKEISNKNSTPLNEARVAPPASGIAISSRAQQMQKAKELAMAAPDINQEKVDRFKQMIKDGTYKVDAEAVAERMLNEHLE